MTELDVAIATIAAAQHGVVARRQLSALQKDAREKYGTDDVAELRQKLESMKAENETKRRTYQADLDRIESELAQVEQSFAQSNGNGEPA